MISIDSPLFVTASAKGRRRETIKARLRFIVFCGFLAGACGICQGEISSWKSRTIKGYFEKKDGGSQTVEDYSNLTEFHTLVYRKEGIIIPLPITHIKSVTDLGDNQIQITKKDGEVFTAQIWNDSPEKCMVFTVFQAEATVYVQELDYKSPDALQGEHSQSKISLCDIKTIVFE